MTITPHHRRDVETSWLASFAVMLGWLAVVSGGAVAFVVFGLER